MRPERLAEIDALFEEALELPEEERGRWLAERAANDPELRREVEMLLGHSGKSVAHLIEPVQAFAAAHQEVGRDPLPAGETLGAYTLVRRLGQGGMGVVYLAERTDGSFERQVALKLLPAAGGDGEMVRRFEQERRILARLEHPRIARLLDGGVDRRGLPYLVMEHVEGRPIDEHCDALHLPVESRIALIVEICSAVQAAHGKLVVHRDLKPSNILVSSAGEVKLLDFGIAKLLDPERVGDEHTVAERRAMTPTYASPEQVNGEPISTASDVYQLGLLAYELLTGRRPQASRTSSLSELVELVCRHEPPPPSRAVREAVHGEDAPTAAGLAALRRSTPARLARHFRPEIDAIVERALAKDPARRYATPADLGADLERFLEGRPVRARRASLAFRTRKWVGRNRALTALAATAALATVGYAVAVTVQSRAIERQRERATLEAAKATAVERFLIELFEGADPRGSSAGADITACELLERGAARVDLELADQPEVQARLRSALGEIEENLGFGATAREMLGDALAVQRRLLGEDNVDVAQTHRRLGSALWSYGDRTPAMLHLTTAVDRFRRLLPPDDPRIAGALAELGQAKYVLGDHAGGEVDLQECLSIHRGNGSMAGVANALSILAALELNRRDFALAERYARESLEIERNLYGERSVHVSGSLYTLGASRRAQGELESAREYFEQAVAIDREILGPRHVELAKSLNSLAMVNQQLGRLERADEIYAESLSILQSNLTPDHPSVVEARQGLGALRVRQHRYTEAEAILRDVVVEQGKHKGPAASRRLRLALLWLGRSLAGLERTAAAVEAWTSGLAVSPEVDDEVNAFLRRELEAAGAPPAGSGPPAQAVAGVSSSR